MLGRLMPREGRFFDLFNQHAALVVKGSHELAELMANYSDLGARQKHVDAIDAAERAADKITRETVLLLRQSFVTPFDRDEIHQLITRLDDILDLIQDVAESAMLFDLQRITPEARQLADLSRMCTDRVADAVRLLANMNDAQHTLKICQQIDQIESDADRVMRAGMSKLFRDEADVRQLIKLKAIYEQLEAVTDRCEDVANVIEGVVLENA